MIDSLEELPSRWGVKPATGRALLAGGLLALAAACCVALIMNAPHSKAYAPTSSWEAREMARASRHVYPNDIRSNLGAHRAPVVWAGLLREAEFIADPSRPVVRMTVEHHYFDWIEDHGAQLAIYLLSPRREGTFRCTWPLNPNADLHALRRFSVQGSMVVIYGTPARLDGDTVDLGEATYARLIPAHLASTQHLNYGRSEPPGRGSAPSPPLASGTADASL